MRTTRSVYWRRRATALAILALVAFGLGALLSGSGEAPSDRAVAQPDKAGQEPRLAELPRGGRRIFPAYRVVAFYGAPQDEQLGVLGIGTPTRAARGLQRVAKGYARRSRPALPAMELLASVAAAHPGDDGKYRLHQPDAVIERYLKAARKAKALLLLDIQPGRADFVEEAMRLDKWLREPDSAWRWIRSGIRPAPSPAARSAALTAGRSTR